MGKDGKSTIISPRRPDTSPQVGVGNPGPGQYDQNKYSLLLKSPATARIGTAQRSGLFNSSKDTPAPNQYQTKNLLYT